MNEKAHETIERTGDFPTDTSGLPRAVAPRVVELADGGTTELHIGPVIKRVGDADVRMLAYSGSIPGPTLKIPEGATVTVHVKNEGDLDATVHWHGLRLENRYDGTHDTQAPIPVGETFTYEVHVPDPGAYWYHPHIREDYGQEMGLYGNIHVVPADPEYWPPVHRELFLTLDDVLIEDGKIAGFSASETTYVAMGRFGNVMLVSGEPDLALTARRGEVVRFYSHQHCQHSCVQRNAAWSPHEARRRRQRPLRTRDLRRGSTPIAVRAVRGRRPLRASGRVPDGAPNASPLVSARVDHGERRAGRAATW